MPTGIPKGKKRLTADERKANKNTGNKKYRTTEKGKVTARKATKKYGATKKGVKYRKEWIESGKKHTSDKKYNESEKGASAIRLIALQYYSKRLSNSDIPCCHCCGQNSHIDFLEVDHILGQSEMDSIPEVVELGYSSTKSGGTLYRWIVENNYLKDLQTEYFQILCKNCNQAKGMEKNNNECPLEGKPH